jgi:hypothetical protein
MAGPDPISSGESSFVHRPGDAWEVEASVRAGGILAVELIPAGGYRWTAIESSDPATATASTEVGTDGVVTATVSAMRTGDVTLSATTSHTGDRFGPPTRIWRMTLHVVA